MTEPFTDSIRGISDFGKSQAQLDYEYAQEMGYVYGYESGVNSNLFPGGPLYAQSNFDKWLRTPYYPGAYTPKIPGNPTAAQGLDVTRLFLGQIRRYYTHEEIMRAAQPAGATLMPKGKPLSFKETLGPIFHAIAGVIAYVPGFGTAVAFVLNTATSLAEGRRIDDAVLSGVRGALPGQPASTMAFDAAVAIAQGEAIEDIAISTAIGALPVGEDVKGYIKTGARVLKSLAEGKRVDATVLNEVYYALPPTGQTAMSMAQRAAKGENVGDIAVEEAGRAAMNAGQEAVNTFIANVGYQELAKQIPQDINNAINAGTALSAAMSIQSGTAPVKYLALGRVESAEARAKNDSLARQGRSIALYDVPLTIYRNSPPPQVKSENRADWQRGFDVGIGAAEGLTSWTPDIRSIESSLGTIPPRTGFNTAVTLQYERTKRKLDNILKGSTMSLALGRILSADDYAKFVQAAAKGAVIAQSDPQVTAARNLNADPRYKWGFDIATSVCQGMSLPGPGQSAIRTKLGPFSPGSGPMRDAGSNVAMQGFDTGQAIQHGLTKAKAERATIDGSADHVAGVLIANGLAGSGSPGDIKAAVVAQTASNPAVQGGVATVIAEKEGFFTKILKFFGLG